jgi:HK97 family phage portal protein
MGIAQTIYDWLGNKLSTSGDVITTDIARCKYMELARLIGASYVSAAVQACDIRFYGADGRRTLDDAAWLWNVSPNQNYSADQLLDAMVNQMFERGEALVVPFQGYSGASTLWYATDWTVNEQHGIGTADHFTNVMVEGQPMKSDYYASQVYRFNLDATPDKRFSQLKKAIGDQYSALADSAATAYKGGNTRRYKWRRSSTTSGTLKEQQEQLALMKKQVQAFVSSDSIAVWPEYTGNELESFSDGSSTANASTDFVSIRKDMFELAASCMRMPTSMLYGNVNNFSTVFDSFITFAIDPVAKVIGDEITRKTYTQDEWAAGAHCDLDTSQIKHRDLYDAAGDIDKLIADGVNSVNDTLRDFGRDLIDEAWADEHLRTKNYETANSKQNAGGENDE